ncbi:MAG: hypothetical protein C0179_00805 [Fervidicoccus sp.]|nr:MAG: hypothetical protein C0179_00805 [Fervidicoccus sp.]
MEGGGVVSGEEKRIMWETKRIHVIIRDPKDVKEIILGIEIEKSIDVTENIRAGVKEVRMAPLHVFSNERIADKIREEVEGVEKEVDKRISKVKEALEEVRKIAQEKGFEVVYEVELG